MTIKSILKTACLFLNKEELCDKIDIDDMSILSDSEKEQILFLLKCLNLVYQEIATDYFPLLNKEVITTTDGKVLFSNLQKEFLEVISLKDCNGQKVRFRSFPSYLETAAEKVEIVYKYLPSDLESLTSTMETFSNKVSEKTFAFGVAMEYSFINGLYEDAQIWEKRFKDALFIRSCKKSNIKLPVRRWF